ncbi:MAG TPA: AI-2E family transporter [Cyclobacteriaceae bacterium]|nr:AI-2E family transporter [Cyclobacteriaceae bacterium]
MMIDKPRQLDHIYKLLVIIAISVTGIVLMRSIIIPLAFAALFALVLNPVALRIERRTGKILSITIVLLGSLILLGLLIWFIIGQLKGLVQSLPGLEEKFFAGVLSVNQYIEYTFNFSTDEQTAMMADSLKNLSVYLGEVLYSTSYLAYFFIQVPIYIFLFLLYREKFREFFMAFNRSGELKWKKDIDGVVRGYISGLTIVVLIAGTLNSIGLLALGIEHAIFFGFFSGALTLIPYVGITIGATLPALLALITKDSAWYAVGVVGVHAAVQFLEGNFITPKITGSKISVNALAAILALLIGNLLLGIAGMILAVPAVGILKILMASSTSLKPFVILLEDKPSEPVPAIVEPVGPVDVDTPKE